MRLPAARTPPAQRTRTAPPPLQATAPQTPRLHAARAPRPQEQQLRPPQGRLPGQPAGTKGGAEGSQWEHCLCKGEGQLPQDLLGRVVAALAGTGIPCSDQRGEEGGSTNRATAE